jgi:hypothetical protein
MVASRQRKVIGYIAAPGYALPAPRPQPRPSGSGKQ